MSRVSAVVALASIPPVPNSILNLECIRKFAAFWVWIEDIVPTPIEADRILVPPVQLFILTSDVGLTLLSLQRVTFLPLLCASIIS